VTGASSHRPADDSLPHLGRSQPQSWPWLAMVWLAVWLPATAGAQVVDSTLWCFSPGDRVLAVAPMGDTIYLGGSFLYVGPATGGGVPVDARSALPVAHYPRVVGEVDAVVADGSGGWFIGGRFTHVDAEPRSNLAHVAANGSVLPWAPKPNDRVWALALQGDTLFVGGDFDTIGGAPRGRLAALTGEGSIPLPWQCDADGRVSALLVNSGVLYAGGWFSTLAGQPRSYVGAITTDMGALSSWQLALDDRVRVFAIVDTTLFIGGYFRSVNGESHWALAAVGAQTGVVHPWDALLDRTPVSTIDGGAHINALLVEGDSLVVAGSYSSLGGQPRAGLAKLDVTTGLATPWHVRAHYPRALGPEFWALSRSGDTLFVAGQFDSLAGVLGANAAALSLLSADRLNWNPRTNDYIFALALQGTQVYLGGWYTSIGDWVERRGLAAIDAHTGRVTDWNPNPNDYVKSLLAWGGKIYVGGYFSTVGGQPRNFIAVLDPVTGEATSWNPGANGAVWALQPSRHALVAGGLFTSIAGHAVGHLGAIDTTSGLSTEWDAAADGDVYALAVTDSAIYVGGDFTSCRGQPRASLAALDPLTGTATPWNPGTDGAILGMATQNGAIYVGGLFSEVGGAPRDCLAAVDRSGLVTLWAPDPGVRVEAVAAADSTVFAGGFFSGASGVSSEYFVALDATTAAVDTRYPTPNGPVWALAAQSGGVYVGGGFGQVARWPQESFALIRYGQRPTPPETREFELAQCVPNPVHTDALIRYNLPVSLPVTLTVYDLQGRRVASVLSHAVQSAGQHSAIIPTEAWRPGCYLYRLEAGHLSAKRKMVVVK
jgi:beta-propeller uncharacterized protein DUF5122